MQQSKDALLAQGLPGEGDVALILHTSGTTSRPKIVPLTQANIAASARHIGASLALSPSIAIARLCHPTLFPVALTVARCCP